MKAIGMGPSFVVMAREMSALMKPAAVGRIRKLIPCRAM